MLPLGAVLPEAAGLGGSGLPAGGAVFGQGVLPLLHHDAVNEKALQLSGNAFGKDLHRRCVRAAGQRPPIGGRPQNQLRRDQPPTVDYRRHHPADLHRRRR